MAQRAHQPSLLGLQPRHAMAPRRFPDRSHLEARWLRMPATALRLLLLLQASQITSRRMGGSTGWPRLTCQSHRQSLVDARIDNGCIWSRAWPDIANTCCPALVPCAACVAARASAPARAAAPPASLRGASVLARATAGPAGARGLRLLARLLHLEGPRSDLGEHRPPKQMVTARARAPVDAREPCGSHALHRRRLHPRSTQM